MAGGGPEQGMFAAIADFTQQHGTPIEDGSVRLAVHVARPQTHHAREIIFVLRTEGDGTKVVETSVENAVPSGTKVNTQEASITNTDRMRGITGQDRRLLRDRHRAAARALAQRGL